MHTKYKGILGEYIAVLVLLIKGYHILEMRYKTFCGEIDIIAQKKNTLVFVEVKTRKSTEKCYNAITNKQLNRIQRASNIFLKRNSKLYGKSIRYDVILISNWKLPIHIKNVSM